MLRSKSVRTLAVALVLTSLFAAPAAGGPAPSALLGPLRVLPTNPRYFTDGTGKAIYLTGSHTWGNLADFTTWPPFDYPGYLDFLQRYNHNFIRLWGGDELSHVQVPYNRTGPGTARDGGPRINFDQLDQAYFDRLRSRIVAARDRGIYVGIMLFSPDHAKTEDWNLLFWNPANNVQGINADTNGDGSGAEAYDGSIARITGYQEAFVRKVIDTVNDLDNVLYEVGNEGDLTSIGWQHRFIDFIRTYEAGMPKRHPIGMTAVFNILNGSWAPDDGALFSSAADWVSPAVASYKDNPPAANGSKVIIADVDHIWPTAPQRGWIWECFLRGIHPILMDWYSYGDPTWVSPAEQEAIRKYMGYTLTYADKMDLASMTPQNGLSSTGYCLAATGSEYLAYQPGAGGFSLNLAAGTYAFEWFNPSTGSVAESGSLSWSGGSRSFTAPFGGEAVLYLKLSAPVPPPPVVESHWLEAEFPNGLTAPMQVSGDGSASGGQYVHVPAGSGVSLGSPGPGTARFTFSVTQPGEYVVWGRIMAPAGNSFFVQMDGSPDLLWDVPIVTSWQWDGVNDRNTAADPVRFSLSAGTHSILFKQREEDTRLDKILITNDLGLVPSGAGGAAENGGGGGGGGGGGAPEFHWLEAEFPQSLSTPMQVNSDGAASGGQYVHVPVGSGVSLSSPGPGTVTYTFSVSQPGDYVLWGRIMAPAGNSFFVQMDGGPDRLWDTPVVAAWQWDAVNDRNTAADPVRFTLSTGAHTLTFKQREEDTRLDKILITNDLSYVPGGQGGAAENGGGGSPELLWLEAEFPQSLSAPMQVNSDGGASGGQYVHVPVGSGISLDGPGPGAASYTFTISVPGEYVVWGRSMAPAGNSFFVQMDDGPDNLWDIVVGTSWQWDTVSDRSTAADPVRFALAAGTHTIRFKHREEDTRLDKILITNDLSYVPSGTGGTVGILLSAMPASGTGGGNGSEGCGATGMEALLWMGLMVLARGRRSIFARTEQARETHRGLR